jgi:hypothetical protein
MPRRNWKFWLFAALPASLGIFWIILALLPYGILKPFTDSLMPDGNFNSLKPWNAEVFKVLFGLGGLVFLGLAVLTGLRRWKLFGTFFKQLWADAGHFFASLRLCKDELGFSVTLLAIIILAIVYRLKFIYSPFHHDEAYTYVAFSRSFFTAVTDYHLPNNHIFHSILVYFSTKIFGIQPWTVRLPAFMAGVLLIPATYWLAKRLYDRWTALGAVLLVAYSPMLVGYSTDARGYTLIALFTLATLTLGDIVVREKNLFAWVLISLFSALGFYTIPVMLFPFGVLFVWLFLENQAEGITVSGQPNAPGSYRTKREFIWHWLAAGFGAAFITLLLYTPVFIFTGPDKFFANGFIAPLPWRDLLETWRVRFLETWDVWTYHVHVGIIILLIAGLTLSLVFYRWLSERRIPLQLATLIWVVILLVIQRPNTWSKLWVFLEPLVFIWSTAGIFGLLQRIRWKFVRGSALAAVVIGSAILFATWQTVRLVPMLPEYWATHGDDEQMVLFVQSQLQEGDLIVVSSPDDAPVWYYSELHGIADAHFDSRNSIFVRALVLVDSAEGQTPASVIAMRGPDPAVLDVESARLLETFGKLQVFEVPHK